MMTVVSAALAVPAVAAPAAAAPGSRQVLYTLGSNTFGELGDGTITASTSPVLVSGLPGTVRQVAAGWETSAALLTNGTVWTWGNNYYGGLGYGYIGGTASTPQQVPGLSGITEIAMSSEGNGYAVSANGSLWAWGDNADGNLGDGTTTSHLTPEQVPGLTGIASVVASNTSFALTSSGTADSWGSNTFGNLGTGTSAAYTTSPARLPGLTGSPSSSVMA